MSAQQDRRGRSRYNFKLAGTSDKPFLRFGVIPLLTRNPIGVASQRISFGDPIQEIEFALARQPAKSAVAHFFTLFKKLSRLQMISHQRQDLLAHIVTLDRMDVQFFQKTERRSNSRFFVSTRAQTAIDELRRRRLAEIVGQGSQHYCHLLWIGEIVNQFARAINYQPRMDKDITFRVPLGILRNIDERFDFRKKLIERAQSVQPTQPDRGTLRAQE